MTQVVRGGGSEIQTVDRWCGSFESCRPRDTRQSRMRTLISTNANGCPRTKAAYLREPRSTVDGDSPKRCLNLAAKSPRCGNPHANDTAVTVVSVSLALAS